MQIVKDFIHKFFFLINFLVALYSLLVFQISYAADINHWFAGFLMLSVPLAFAANLFFMIVYALAKSWRFLLSFFILLAAFPLWKRTLTFHADNSSEFKGKSLQVLSYNVMYCDNARAQIEPKPVEDLVYAMDTISVDIKCFQELYNRNGHPFLNTFEVLSKGYPHYTYMHSEIDKDRVNGAIGLAIFSKYPIVHKEEFSWKTNNNGVLIADIAVNTDTIRVFNIQTKSMGIRVEKVIASENDETMKKETRNILSQLKSGFKDRAVQVKELEELIDQSPYPVILAGDLNELPYGYAYGRVHRKLDNAFEKSGNGFGFTYHKLPSFLRIDNVFFDPQKFQALEFETLQSVPNSDHYPIIARLGILD
ncbi:endonuclease/exonuclease/phosphatase family protein [Marinilongibacter aquaticus]|uniref:endonuclease/exonuclease/phosphatase family protein n=1 Tax=Marinilongibacter aquaticus TaxID=2975157 RepID=UPI0021BD5E3B|nr:endonuclease/exonuclease/phosphatase family protein [Marinilongibacter aquaticus]UBM60141.1 endonuclease/exonuclease/phosphatase family protein [Marinilongibacter aquaticus]